MYLNKFKLFNKKYLFFLILSFPLLLGAGCNLNTLTRSGDGGVWVSSNKGETWEQKIFVAEEKKKQITIASLDISFLKFHPQDSRIIYASTNKGVYFTENNADIWQLIFTGGFVNDLVPDPVSRGTIYLTLTNRLMKTENNGGQWLQIYVDSRPGISITQVEVDPLDSSRIYIGTSNGDLILSLDSGRTWQVVNEFKNPIAEIIVNPRDTYQIYVATQNQGIWVSFDQGENWDNLKENYKEFKNANNFKLLIYDETRDGAMLYASDYGLLWTYDGGFLWHQVELLTPPNSINIRALALNPNNPDEIYYANEKVFYKTSNGGVNWVAQNLPTSRAGSSLLVDFFDDNKVYLGVRKVEQKRRGFGF